ncbi:Hypothetical predicted protein [Pelobates cultripes]|uniref:Uncharacterized protein n=1 Tax=Pelobates cultripes TaxID=61616 RepID=A0AAD1SBD3_PELCU|nr:Hypothetical predicted protein [Pelobates cultripes]
MSSPIPPDKADREKMSAPVPKKGTSKSKHLCYLECAVPLPDGCRKKTCNQCSTEVLEKAKQTDMSSFLCWLQENLSQTFESFKDAVKKEPAVQDKQTKKRRRERSPSLSDLSSGECSSSLPSNISSLASSLEEGFPPEEIKKFIKVATAVQEPEPTKGKVKGFPMLPKLMDLLQREWKNPERRAFISKHFKLIFKLQSEEKWDIQIAQLSKTTTIPIVQVSGLKDPMDKQAETSCRRIFQAAGYQCRAEIADSAVLRAQNIWLQALEKSLMGKSDNDPAQLMFLLKLSNEFLSDASDEILRTSGGFKVPVSFPSKSETKKDLQSRVKSAKKLKLHQGSN